MSPAPNPLKRFAGWTPDVIDVGPQETAVGTGVAYQFVFRTDYVVSFDVPYLTQAEIAVALRIVQDRLRLVPLGRKLLVPPEGLDDPAELRVLLGQRHDLHAVARHGRVVHLLAEIAEPIVKLLKLGHQGVRDIGHGIVSIENCARQQGTRGQRPLAPARSPALGHITRKRRPLRKCKEPALSRVRVATSCRRSS